MVVKRARWVVFCVFCSRHGVEALFVLGEIVRAAE